jgi:hippurate hydrolase
MPIPNRIAALFDQMQAWRHDLHAHPELGFQERRTSELVAAKLAEWGIEVHRGIAGTGVVGVLKGQGEGPSIGLRADMDALPMEEANDVPHRSRHAGAMHACGHDGHTTMLLGAAKHLAETRNFSGTVNFIFQPAEEGLGGGREMVKEGLFQRFPCDAVYAVHNDPTIPLGEAAAIAGPVLAASDRFQIKVRAKGGHAALPHLAVDPVLIGAHIVTALQSIVSRRVDPISSAVVSVTMFHAGSAMNVIPDEAELKGTARTMRPEVQDFVEAAIARIATQTAEAHDAVAEVTYTRGYPPTVNHPEQTERAAATLAEILGERGVRRDHPPSMGGEDFSFLLNERPGAFLLLGQRAADGRGGVPVHHPRYDFNDALLPIGAAFFVRMVERELPRR